MTEEQYRNLKIKDIVYNTGKRLILRISSQLSDPDDIIGEDHYLSATDFKDSLRFGESLCFKDIKHWDAPKYLDDIDILDWFKVDILNIRLSKLEVFVYKRLRS